MKLTKQQAQVIVDKIKESNSPEKTIRTYNIVCPSCQGLGYVENPAPVTSTAQIVCPACNGTKVVLVTEAD